MESKICIPGYLFVRSAVTMKDLDFLVEKQKISLSEELRTKFLQQVHKDTEFLETHGMNDYSLIIGVVELDEANEATAKEVEENLISSGEGVPFYRSYEGGILSRDKTKIYYMRIIDFLTFYGAKKKLEYALKWLAHGQTMSCIPPESYAKRLMSLLEQNFD